MAKTENTTELVLVDPKEFGLIANQTSSIEEAFKPKRIESDTFATQYELIVKQELNPETFKQARELRLKLVKVRTGIADVHKAEKAFYLASGKFVDALKNKLTVPIEQMEEKLAEIEQYEIRLAKEAKEKLKAERLELLAPFEVDVQFVSIEEMTPEQFDGFLANNKLAFETKIEQAKQAELARIEQERLAEVARLEQIEKDRLDRIRIEKENTELKAKEEVRQKRFAEMQPIAIMFRDFNGVIELPEDEYQKQLAEHKIGYQQHLEFQHEQEIKKQAEAEKLERERIKSESDAKKLRLENDKLKAEQESEKLRIEQEEAEKLAKEKALANSDDQTKVKAFYELFKSVEFPELNSEAGKAMSKDINARMAELKKQIISQAKGLM